MKTTTIIGSPRGQSSNSNVIGKWFNQGENHTLFLSKINRHESYIDELKDTSHMIFIFPLYVDGMPAQVKAFFEAMDQHRSIFKGKKVVYIIHSGFPDGIHLENLKKYLVLFSDLLDLDHQGIIAIPGSEGFRLMPEKMTKKKASLVGDLGQDFINGRSLEQESLVKLQGPLHFSKSRITLYKIMSSLGLANLYWDSNLKRNNAYKDRFAAPYSGYPKL